MTVRNQQGSEEPLILCESKPTSWRIATQLAEGVALTQVLQQSHSMCSDSPSDSFVLSPVYSINIVLECGPA